MVSDGDKFEEVASLIETHLAASRTEITPQARLAEDLGCDGDDADELMVAYAKHFGVDMSAYSFLDYFGWEGDFVMWPFWVHLWCTISSTARNELARGEARIAPLRVWHLAHCVETKVWQHPDHFDQTPREPMTMGLSRHIYAAAWRLPFVVVLLLLTTLFVAGPLFRPTFPGGLFMLGIGGVMLWSLHSSVRAARSYYADRRRAAHRYETLSST